MARRPSVAPAIVSANRVTRSPVHHFHLRTIPFQIQPFLLAPVLPGETMTNLMLRARVVSDPIKNPLIGWWNEYYFFYVKHRDLTARDTLTEMMLDPDVKAPVAAAAVPEHNHFAGGTNWANMCLERVVDEYFRNEGEAWNAPMRSNLPLSGINLENWTQSLMRNDQMVSDDDLNVDLNANSTITAGEVDRALRMWQFQRANNLTDMDYDDFLATYGIRTAAVELHRPELLRYVRQWTYPVNTVDPATGAPSSALSWSIEERADKNRFFTEPGFIFGVTVTRPKVYLRNLKGSMAHAMNDAIAWLPAIMMDDPNSSLRLQANGTGPLPAINDAGGYWFDVKDLFMYGDQFVNFDPAAVADANMLTLPLATGARRFASDAETDAMFKTAAANKVKADGIVTLGIRSVVRDTTPGTPTV